MIMGKVSTGFSMSLDGFVAGPKDEVDMVFKWMSLGSEDYTATIGDEELKLKMSKDSVEMHDEQKQTMGALVAGRRLFDIAGAWGGRHPMDVPIVVLTHHPPQEWVDKEGSPFTFVAEGGIESALDAAQKIAGEKSIAIASPSLVQQAMNLGLLEEIHIDLAHVLLGKGIPLFAHLNINPADLKLTHLVKAPGVTHLTFDVIH
jgi:dihydrofolate reductase